MQLSFWSSLLWPWRSRSLKQLAVTLKVKVTDGYKQATVTESYCHASKDLILKDPIMVKAGRRKKSNGFAFQGFHHGWMAQHWPHFSCESTLTDAPYLLVQMQVCPEQTHQSIPTHWHHDDSSGWTQPFACWESALSARRSDDSAPQSISHVRSRTTMNGIKENMNK